MAAAARVLVEILGDGVLAGLLDEVRRREVGEALPQIDRAPFVGQGGEFGKDGGAEAGDPVGRFERRGLVRSGCDRHGRIAGWIRMGNGEDRARRRTGS